MDSILNEQRKAIDKYCLLADPLTLNKGVYIQFTAIWVIEETEMKESVPSAWGGETWAIKN